MCECNNWAKEGYPPLTNHHKNCKNYTENLEKESVEIINNLIKGIEYWASQEDGIPDELYDSYQKALFFVGQINKALEVDKK